MADLSKFFEFFERGWCANDVKHDLSLNIHKHFNFIPSLCNLITKVQHL